MGKIEELKKEIKKRKKFFDSEMEEYNKDLYDIKKLPHINDYSMDEWEDIYEDEGDFFTLSQEIKKLEEELEIRKDQLKEFAKSQKGVQK